VTPVDGVDYLPKDNTILKHINATFSEMQILHQNNISSKIIHAPLCELQDCLLWLV